MHTAVRDPTTGHDKSTASPEVEQMDEDVEEVQQPGTAWNITTPQHRIGVRHLTLKNIFINGQSDAKDDTQTICR
jgi:hypothetical protein